MTSQSLLGGVTNTTMQTTYASNFTLSILSEGDDNEPAAKVNLALAISISLCTNIVQSLGVAIQRKSHVLNDNVYPPELRKAAIKRPLWIAGFTTYITANIIGSVFAIGYLPIVILAPIGAMGLIFNAFFARVILGDPFTKQTALGTILTAVGAMLIGLFGYVPEPTHSLDDLIYLWSRPAFIAYFAVLEVVIMVGLVLTHLAERRLNRLNADGIQLVDDEARHGWFNWKGKETKVKPWIGVSYGVLSGNISSQSLLCAKSGTELLILSILYGENQFDRPLTWFLVGLTLISAVLQLFYLNKGLQLCDTVLLIPLAFCSFNASSIFNGLVYYSQWQRLRWYQVLLVLVGIALLLGGVLILSWRSSGSNILPEEEMLTSDLTQGDADAVLLDEDVDVEAEANGPKSPRPLDVAIERFLSDRDICSAIRDMRHHNQRIFRHRNDARHHEDHPEFYIRRLPSTLSPKLRESLDRGKVAHHNPAFLQDSATKYGIRLVSPKEWSLRPEELYADHNTLLDPSQWNGKPLPRNIEDYRDFREVQNRSFALKAALGYIKNSQDSDARRCYKQATDMDPECIEAWLRWGALELYLQHYEEAVQCFNHAQKFGGNCAQAKAYIDRMQGWRTGKYKEFKDLGIAKDGVDETKTFQLPLAEPKTLQECRRKREREQEAKKEDDRRRNIWDHRIPHHLNQQRSHSASIPDHRHSSSMMRQRSQADYSDLDRPRDNLQRDHTPWKGDGRRFPMDRRDNKRDNDRHGNSQTRPIEDRDQRAGPEPSDAGYANSPRGGNSSGSGDVWKTNVATTIPKPAKKARTDFW
ncbi:hypothetical protein BZG36_00434 [Bifiguratus adelaidae]|uniref:Uncharacterized protein n=1 Tax=Bifiguratus adelaidae TaxID=1938954 RepID=A0A261Y7V4_9FUNG|nr:hypothetical protein BZG36_00434 [Bifiguratus adelaidae]